MNSEMAVLIIELYNKDKKLDRIIYEKVSAFPMKHLKYFYHLAQDICATHIMEGFEITKISFSYFVGDIDVTKVIWRK